VLGRKRAGETRASDPKMSAGQLEDFASKEKHPQKKAARKMLEGK
jgi:hypothetical protein